jgi:hypothetical protein
MKVGAEAMAQTRAVGENVDVNVHINEAAGEVGDMVALAGLI